MIKDMIKKISHILPDKVYLAIKYRMRLGYWMDFNNPKTYNEKLQWLKLHEHNPKYTMMVDKYEVKKYITDTIGEQYVIPTLGVWDRFEDIDFDMLPDQFVLKCTHDSGGLAICKDKKTFNITDARKKINKSLGVNYYWQGREWPYKNVKPRIIAEKFIMDSATQELRDYKFYTFNGKVKTVMVNTDRGSDTKADYFDVDYNHLDLCWGYENASNPPSAPINFKKMIRLAEILAQDTCALRVDFYEVDGNVYFGELTFFDGSGMQAFSPVCWDAKFGEWLKLPGAKNE